MEIDQRNVDLKFIKSAEQEGLHHDGRSPNHIFMIKILSPWTLTTILNICQELCRDIYDLYAEYEEEDVQDQFMSPHLLLSPVKHLYLNINVGGTVSSFIFKAKVQT